MDVVQIRYKKLREDAKTPYRKYDVDAGFDLTAVWREETDKYIVYGTGLAFEIPEGYVGLMFPRSSVTNQDLMLKNGVGVIDASYRGEIMCRFAKVHNDIFLDYTTEKNGKKWDGVVDLIFLERDADYYEVGDRVCQVVFIKLPEVKMLEVAELSETERGTAGYGSSGNK